MPYQNVMRYSLSTNSPTMEYNLSESRDNPATDKDGNDATRVRLIVEGAVMSDGTTPDGGAFTLSISDARAKKTDGSSADPPWISLGTEFMCGFRPDVGYIPQTAVLDRKALERLGVDVIRITLDPILLAEGSTVYFWVVEECNLDPARTS